MTTDIDELRKVLDLMEGEKIMVDWDNTDNHKKYHIGIDTKSFVLEEKALFFLLDFYGFKSFYPHNDNDAIIQIPKLYYKDQELKSLLKDRHMQKAFWSYKKDENITENINRIMRKRYENMKTLYFAHPMITYDTFVEEECLNIIEREIGNKLPSSIKEIINPNSDEYKWKGERDMHETEDWIFSWSKFANSMPHYCNLVHNSDGLIYLPIFDLNTRKNARMKFTRKIKRGVKTEISYCTKLGDPLITFTEPNNNMLPTGIDLPYYMLDRINGRITGLAYGGGNNEKIINNIDNNEIGSIEGNIIKDNSGVIIAEIVKYAYVSCDKCHHYKLVNINETVTEIQLNEFIKIPHKDCGGIVSFSISDYEHMIDKNGNTVGSTNIVKDFTTNTSTKYITWISFKGNICHYYNKEENSRRYNSPYPFHMYINKTTNEIHEKPEDAGCAGGDFIPFEPWNMM